MPKQSNRFINPNDRLKTAAIILIAVGIAETIAFVLALYYQFDFAGGSLVYVYAGYRLLKRDTQTYKIITLPLTGMIVLFIAGILSFAWLAIFVLEVGNLSAKLSLPIEFWVTITYGLIVVTLTSLLFHPETRRELNLELAGQSPWTLFLSRRRMFGVVVCGGLLASLFLGPSLASNPLRLIVSAIQQDPQVRTVVGGIDKIFLLSIRVFNWAVYTRIEVAGSNNTGFYYAELSPTGVVRLDSYDFERMLDLVPTLSRSPEVVELRASDIASENNVLLLSTSFESQTTNAPDEILPLIQEGKLPWVRQATARTGQYAINAIPEGNPGLLSYFSESLSKVLLSSRLDGGYEAFDVRPFNIVTLEFWRFSTSNPSETHNCLGSVSVDYKFDDQDWQTKMVYCGRHKSKLQEWRRSLLTFETAAKERMEIRFEYEFPPSSKLDKTVVYLIDDLQIRGIR